MPEVAAIPPPAPSSPPSPPPPSPFTPPAPSGPPVPAAQEAARAPHLPFGVFLGLRYLRPRRTFVSIITLISVAGVALGVAMLIIVISVMTGYDAELRSHVLGFDPHLIVMDENGLVEHWRAVRQQALGTPGVLAAAPFMMGPVLADHAGKRVSPKIRGVMPELEGTVIDIPALMAHGKGKFDLDGDKAVVGIDLARALNLHVGDRLTIYSPRSLEALANELDKLKDQKADEKKIEELRSLVSPVEVEVTGLFDSGRAQYDADILFVPLYLGQELYEMHDQVHGVSARTADPYRAETVKRALLERLQSPLNVETWMEHNAPIFNAVRTERATMFVILSVVVVVAAFCVMNTLITVTVQKTREIGIMKAVGASEGQVVGVFLYQGVAVGVLGTLGGLALGVAVLRLLNPFKDWMERAFGVEVFSRQVYGFAQIPYATRWQDLAVICAGAFVMCSLAALIPALLAARRDPVKALRFE